MTAADGMTSSAEERAAGTDTPAGSLVRPQPRIRESDERSWLERNLLGVLVFAHINACVLIPVFMSESSAFSFTGIPVYILMGTLFTVPVAIGFALVYAPVHFFIRVLLTAFVVGATYGGLWAGDNLFYGGDEIRELLDLFTIWPGLVLGFAFAFAIMRFVQAKVLVRSGDPFDHFEKLSIIGIMMATALVALCTAIAGTQPELTTMFGISAVACAAIGLLLVVPMTVFLFQARKFWVWLTAICVLAFIVSMTAVYFSAFTPKSIWINVGFGLTTAAMFATWGVHIHAYRAAGYSLAPIASLPDSSIS